MLEHIADFTAWPIITGILIGYVANRIMSGEGKGCCMNLIVGIIGSYAGTFLHKALIISGGNDPNRITTKKVSELLTFLFFT